MKSKCNFVFSLSFLSVFSMNPNCHAINNDVIYGEDNRRDLFETLNPGYARLAQSTVALIRNSNLTQNSSGLISIKAETLREFMNTCSDEPYTNQPSGAFCSGSLISSNRILTAGHCITTQKDCEQTSFVFDYSVKTINEFPTQTKEGNVYRCKSIVHREQSGNGADFAIITVDRFVENREPLILANERSLKEIEVGTELLMIGHPSGLPTKIDDGASVRSNKESGYFVATTDSYGGNSGSAVFNRNTGRIEGVLVRGEKDFNYDSSQSCYRSNVCPENGCSGEDVTKISSVIPYL